MEDGPQELTGLHPQEDLPLYQPIYGKTKCIPFIPHFKIFEFYAARFLDECYKVVLTEPIYGLTLFGLGGSGDLRPTFSKLHL